VPLAEANAAVALHKRIVDTAPSFTVGETIHHAIDATNTGNVTLTDVTISDALIPTLDCGGFDGIPSPGEIATWHRDRTTDHAASPSDVHTAVRVRVHRREQLDRGCNRADPHRSGLWGRSGVPEAPSTFPHRRFGLGT
jgi:uncharacterized repeat protein (TIGR01451 family)